MGLFSVPILQRVVAPRSIMELNETFSFEVKRSKASCGYPFSKSTLVTISVPKIPVSYIFDSLYFFTISSRVFSFPSPKSTAKAFAP